MVGSSFNRSPNPSSVDVPMVRNSNHDAVMNRLISAGDQHATSSLNWSQANQIRRSLRRRAFGCIFGSWLMVFAASLVGTIVAWTFSRSAEGMFNDGMPVITIVLPPILLVVTVGLLVIGVLALINQSFPGHATTKDAIDWWSTGDAVSRLLSAGCTYPEAFRTAAKVAKTRSIRRWLIQSANSVEQGSMKFDGDHSTNDVPRKGDASLVELLVQTSGNDASGGWRIVADHFAEVARSRLALLLGTAPVLSTLLAGLIVWVSISATLGSLWRQAISSISGLS